MRERERKNEREAERELFKKFEIHRSELNVL